MTAPNARDVAHMHRQFTRLYQPDPRDRAYGVRTLGVTGRPGNKSWTTGAILDQGNTSECVRYGITQLLATRRIQRSHALTLTHDLYPWAQQDDGFPLPHDGTTVRAGLRYAQKVAGVVASYHMAESMDELLLWLTEHGPVLIGTEWMSGMDQPTARGFAEPSGWSRGGHCTLLTRLSYPATPAKRWMEDTNSWSKLWSPTLGGKFRMTLDAWEYLIFGLNGEAWCVQETAAR